MWTCSFGEEATNREAQFSFPALPAWGVFCIWSSLFTTECMTKCEMGKAILAYAALQPVKRQAVLCVQECLILCSA